MKIYMKYHMHSEYAREPDREDKWDAGDKVIEFYPEGLCKKKPKDSFWDELEIDFEPKYGKEYTLVVVRYSTGSTFGRVDGEYKVIGVFTKEQAEKLQTSILKSVNKKAKDAYHLKMPFKTTQWDGYTGTWTGYFERFENVELHGFEIR